MLALQQPSWLLNPTSQTAFDQTLNYFRIADYGAVTVKGFCEGLVVERDDVPALEVKRSNRVDDVDLIEPAVGT